MRRSHRVQRKKKLRGGAIQATNCYNHFRDPITLDEWTDERFTEENVIRVPSDAHADRFYCFDSQALRQWLNTSKQNPWTGNDFSATQMGFLQTYYQERGNPLPVLNEEPLPLPNILQQLENLVNFMFGPAVPVPVQPDALQEDPLLQVAPVNVPFEAVRGSFDEDLDVLSDLE